MTTPLSLEQRILIAAEYNADRVEVIKELMGEGIKFAEWVDAKYWRVDMFHNSNLWYDKKDLFKGTTYTTEQLYELYLQSNKQVKP